MSAALQKICHFKGEQRGETFCYITQSYNEAMEASLGQLEGHYIAGEPPKTFGAYYQQVLPEITSPTHCTPTHTRICIHPLHMASSVHMHTCIESREYLAS